MVEYLGQMFRSRRLEIASHTMDAIRGLKKPANSTKHWPCLRLRNVNQIFVLSFARLATPLNAMQQKHQGTALGTLSEKKTKLLSTLYNALIIPPVLTLCSTTVHMTLDADACNVQIDCVLLRQQLGGTTYTIVFWPRSFTDAKLREHRMNREILETGWPVLLLLFY